MSINGEEQSLGTEPEQAASSTEVLSALRRFARARPDAERCELCSLELAEDHQHLLDRQSRQIVCSCEACTILFCGQEGAKFLRVPRRVLQLDNFAFTDVEWESMMLPINLAFFLRQPGGGVAAMYPSPAGAMESLIDLPAWDELFGREKALARAEPEVEALLVNRIGKEALYFVVPIDTCYRLIGLIRTKWRGLSGGGEVWQTIAEFFADLERHATHVGVGAHA